MNKQRFIPSLKLTRFQVWKQVVLLALVLVIMLLLFFGYSATRDSAMEHYSINQMLLASQIAGEMQYRFGIIDNALSLWCTLPEMAPLGPEGVEGMEHILLVHSPDISAVTRMDENGIILHSTPFVEGTIGADISGQPHIRRLMETHAPVFSDAFLAVQGYWGLAYHVPVVDEEGVFRGSLAVIVPFREMIDRIFSQILPEVELCIWVLGRDGRILYSQLEEEEGLHYSELSRGFGFDSLAAAAVLGERSRIITEYSIQPCGNASETTPMLSTILPFEVGDCRWSIILATPESEVLQDISGIRNSFMLGAAGILALAILYSTMKLRTRISASQARKWQGMARIQELMKRTIDQAGELVVILDEHQRIIYANPAVESVTGFGESILGCRIAELPFESIKPTPLHIRDQLIQRGRWSGNVEGSGPGARNFRIHLSISRSVGLSSDEIHYILIGTDILLQSEMERRLNEQEKVQAIGQLAGGVAHDFNNLLVGIQGYAELLERRYSDDGEIVRSVRVIQDAVHRGSELTKQLLGYARKGKHKIEPVDLAVCVRNVWMLLKRTMDRRIDVELDLDEGIVVMGDPAQMEQVVLNLAINARDAMPQGGKLRFELHRTVVPNAVLQGCAEGQPMELAVLKTIDTGCGIAAEHIDHIFEPFFTTKREEGTGMGLATVFGIVANHGGWIDVESKPGEGAAFVIHLPLSQQVGDRVELDPVRTTKAHPSGRGTVLLVDDELVVLSTTAELLMEIGYDVLQASDGAMALDLLRAHGEAIDAVMLDLAMPGMDGSACFFAIREMLPGMPVIIASGFSRDGRVQELIDSGADDFLQKPYRLADLAAMIVRLTGAGRLHREAMKNAGASE
jgi:signal transduction histidine kinase/CheY-like chemotaxis protein